MDVDVHVIKQQKVVLLKYDFWNKEIPVVNAAPMQKQRFCKYIIKIETEKIALWIIWSSYVLTVIWKNTTYKYLLTFWT